MNDELRARVAAALGWTIANTESVSIPSLRELVRTMSPKLHHELTLVMSLPGYFTRPR
jgi:hypothetical protein